MPVQPPHQAATSDTHLSRVVVVTPSFWPSLGGVETHVGETVSAMAKSGYSFTIITADRSGQQPINWWWQAAPNIEIPVHTLKIPRLKFLGLLSLWWQMVVHLPLFKRADVIHVHDVGWWFWPVRLLLPSARVVLTMHGWEGIFPIPEKLKLLKQLSATVGDRVLTIGDFINWHYGIHSDAVSYGAVDGESLLKHMGQGTTYDSQPKSQLTIAYAGRLAADTGLLWLLAAAQDLRLRNIRWLFYGDGPLADDCAQVGQVVGWSVEKDWLKTADVIVASGYLSVWEALLAKKPIIAIAQHQLRRDYFAASPFVELIRVASSILDLRQILGEMLESHQQSHRSATETAQLRAGQQFALSQNWRQITDLYHQWYQELNAEGFWQRLGQRWSHIRLTTWHAFMLFKVVLITYLVGVIVSGFIFATGTISTLHFLKSREIASAQASSGMAEVGAQSLAILLGPMSGTITSANHVTQAMHQGLKTAAYAQLLSAEPEKAQPEIYHQMSIAVVEAVRQSGLAQQSACQSYFLPSINQQIGVICALAETEPETFWIHLTGLVEYWLSAEHTLIVVLQNSQELRATGGFMGSYAKITFSGQQLPTFEINDIYEPDGQFQGFIPAPAGVGEYLSAGKGLRLPDANWQPDFPSSAQTILQYFAFGNKQGVDGVVAVNLAVMEQLLDILGPIELADYNVIVTSENLAEVARADRSQFFPGSQQKARFLSALARQIQFRFANLTKNQIFQIAQILWQSLKNREIQAYMVDDEQQMSLDVLGWTGRQRVSFLDVKDESQWPLYFMSVESNVGINKANKAIKREVLLDLYPTQLLIKLSFANQNPPAVNQSTAESVNGMGYVNYQRLFVPTYLKVKTIAVDDQILSTWHEQLIQTASGETLNQIGFILAVPQETQHTAVVTLEHNPNEVGPTDLTTVPGIFIQRQSGMPDTTYVIQTPTDVMKRQVTTDQFVEFRSLTQ